MYCPNCGKELREGEACGCAAVQNRQPAERIQNEYPPNPAGAPFEAQQPPYIQPPYQPYQPPMYQQPCAPGYYAATPVIDILRRHGSSSLMLALVVLLGAGCLISVFDLFTGGEGITGHGAYALGYNIGVALASIMISIPGLVMFIGVLKFYMDCRTPRGPFISGGGLTVIQVMAIVSAAIMGAAIVLYAVVLGIAGTFATAALWEYTDSLPAGLAGMTLSVIYVVLFLVAAVLALYYISFIATVSAVKNNAVTGTPAKRVSMVFVVMLYILGGFSALGVFNIINDPVAAVNSMVYAASCIIGGVLLTRYRNEINMLVRGF